jgi:hypothetical protein
MILTRYVDSFEPNKHALNLTDDSIGKFRI